MADKSKSKWLIASPLMISALATCVILFSTPSLLSWFSIVVLLILGAIFSLKISNCVKASQQSVQQLKEQAQAEIEKKAYQHLNQAICTLMPIWSRQIAHSRDITDDAISQLSRKFTDIVNRLTKMIDVTNNINVEGGLGDCGHIKNSSEELEQTLDTLAKIFASQEPAVREINALVSLTEELKTMAVEASAIAEQTKMLALNVVNEAARAGDDGQDFAVVAGEVHDLSIRSSQTGSKMSQKVDDINAAMGSALTRVKTGVSTAEGVLADSREKIGKVIGDFQVNIEKVSESTKVIQQDNGELLKDISDVLVSLQFQDRSSQMLTHTCDFMKQIEQELPGYHAGLFDGNIIEKWLAESEAAYTMVEQKQLHHNSAPEHTKSSGNNDEVEFF